MKVFRILPALALIVFLSLTSCSTESVAEDRIDSIDVPVAPVAKQIEIEIMEPPQRLIGC